MDNKRGSEWRKWDLHIHTPNTKLNDGFNSEVEFIKKITKSDIKVFGITDYFYFDKNNFVELSKIDGKIFFPNIEFRIDQKNKDGEFINIHLLFNNTEKVINKIGDFLTRLSLFNQNNIDGTKYYCSDLGNQLNYDKAILKLDDLIKGLEGDFNKEDYLIVGAPNGYGGFRPGDDTRGEEYAKGIDKLSKTFLDSSEDFEKSKKNQSFFLNKNRFKGAIKKSLLYSSDAHSEKDIGKKFTWIKADPTFEGLKQIIYEPEERVKIQEDKPTDNFNKIEEIKLDFNSDVKIKANGNDEEYSFCFSDVKEKLYLNDKFNCFIGGRGSGKSSLLNLIYSKISGKEDTDFLENNKLINFDKNSNININYNGEIEFLGQNKIEEFAIDYVKFSKAIYDRLEDQKVLEEESRKLEDYILYLDEYIINIQEVEKNKKELEKLEKRLKNYESIIDVVKGKEYNNLKDKLDKLSEQYYEIKSSKEKYNKLNNEFNNFIKTFPKIDKEKNYYDEKFNDIIYNLEKIKLKIEKYDFLKIEEKQSEIFKKGQNKKEELNEYLIKKGLSEEKLKNLEEAQEGLHKLKVEQESINNNLDNLLELEKTFNIEEGKITYRLYEFIIKKGLEKAEEKLNTVNNENIKNFKFNVDFNIEQAKEDLFENFMNIFKVFQESRLIWDNISKTLFNIEIEKILDGTIKKENFLEEINELGYSKGNEFLQNIFSIESNFDIYKALIAKYKYNLNDYLKINILYDGRPIENSSFGQKCTVVILIMLLFGNKPIIIDEPEAHLDSSLIANYLVDLIKQRKKERQIIFATHNANFVINGDAEQIFILENDENKTSFTQTSIENKNNREKLLKLEGGEEAFKMRGKRY